MKVERISLRKLMKPEEQTAPDDDAVSRTAAPPCGQKKKLKRILNQVLLAQKHLDLLVSQIQEEESVAELNDLLVTCQPLFDDLGSKVMRDRVRTRRPLRFSSQLFNFSQDLCDGFAQLNSSNTSPVGLDACQLNSCTDLCMGQRKVGRLTVTTFLLCVSSPYVSWLHSGLKYIRWNVQRPEGHTDHYFLCHEDLPDPPAEPQQVQDLRRLWSLCRWVQVKPDPETETVYDWILCAVPEGRYERLLVLGDDEPSISGATEALCERLTPQDT